MEALASAHDAAVRMIDTATVRVHQHAACVARRQINHNTIPPTIVAFPPSGSIDGVERRLVRAVRV